MTRSRALKSDIRKAMQPGEAYNAAALRLHKAAAEPAPAPLKRIITAHAYQGGYPQKLHALIDDPAARARMGVGNLVLQGRSLCGSRGGSIDNGGWRLEPAPGDNWERHAGVDFTPEETRYCQECVITWREQYQPDDSETKLCATCSRDLPTNKFRAHKGRKDGLASECEECRRTARAAAKEAREAEEMSAFRQKRRAIAEGWLDLVKGWQESAHLKPFQCTNGHVLSPEITERRHDVVLSWRCACGTAEITRAEYALVDAMSVIQGRRSGGPLTVSVA